mgnify:CR=1 FL=1
MSLFRSILFWLVLVVLGALLAQVLLQDPGYVLVRYRGTDYTTTVAAGVGMLLALGGLYARLYQHQFRHEDPAADRSAH